MRPSSASPMFVAFVGVAVLCAMDAVIKIAGQRDAVVMITLLRYVAGVIISFPLFLWLSRTRPSREAIVGHARRGIVMAGAAFLFYYGLTVIPLAEAITISFIAPLLVPPMAWAVIGERMRFRNIAACGIGFAGVLVAVSGQAPTTSEGRIEGILGVLLSAVLYALSVVLLRQRALKDDPYTISFLAAFFPMLILAPFAFTLAPLPPLESMPLYLLLGALGTAGMLLLTFAYARAEAQQLIVLEYTALGWAALFGWLVFGEVVRIEVIAGAVIIAGACITTAWADRRQAATP